VIVISDTNVLSSLAAGDSFLALFRLYARARMAIPPRVHQELQAGLDRGNAYLQPVLQAILKSQIEVIPLSAEEELLTFNYPTKLDEGEREAIALAQTRKATLLSNDGDAIRYCKQRGIRVISLVNILRLLWMENVMSQDEVRGLIGKMEQVENLSLTPIQVAEIFAPRESRA
jgi:predicted nucleic acid-binding protein